MRHSRAATTLVLAAFVLAAAWVGADDRDFLRERAAPPNILFILDTSGSMVGTTEVVPTGTEATWGVCVDGPARTLSGLRARCA